MRYALSISVILCLAALPAIASASVPQSPIEGDIPTCVVDRGVGAFDIPTHESMMTALHFPGAIKQEVRSRFGHRNFKVKHKKDTLLVAPRPDRRRDAVLSVLILLKQPEWKISLNLYATDDPDEAMKGCRFVARDQAEAEQARIAKAVESARAGDAKNNAAWRDQTMRDAKHQAQVGALQYILSMRRSVPLRPETVLSDVTAQDQDDAQVALSNFEAMWGEAGAMILTFKMENTGDTELAWTASRAYGRDATVNHAGAGWSGAPAEPDKGIMARLAPGQRELAGIVIERAKDISGPMTIVLEQAGGARLARATLHNWIPMQTHHTVRHMELRPVEPPDPEEGKVSLHLQGVYGAIWLGDGTGADLSDATSMTGLGVRAQYAFNRYIAVEGEVMGASTGTARFEDVTYEGAQGELTRSASLGRMQFGGVLRIGSDTYVPILRLGVGLQGASHSGTLTTATGDAPGPDEFAFDLLWYAGVGLDARMGPLVAGLSLAGAKGEGQSLEAGIHLGYAWKP